MSLLIVILNFMLFFSYLFDNKIISLTIIILLLYELLFKKEKINFYKSDAYIIACIFALCMGVILSPVMADSLMYFLLFTSSVFLALFLRNHKEWVNPFLKSSVVFSSVHVAFTLMQYILPSFMNNVIIRYILNDKLYLANMYMFNNGGYAGITGQTGANAFYIAIFIIIIFNLILCKKIKKINFIFVILGIIALLLTDKSGHTLSLLISILISLYVYIYSNSKNKRSVVMIKNIILCISILGLFIYCIVSKNLFSTISALSNGRLEIYKQVTEFIEQNSFLGNGLLYVPYKIGYYAHNIYLQIIAELGIVGFIIFFAFFVSLLRIAYENCIKNSQTNSFTTMLIVFNFIVFFELYGMTGNPIYDGFTLMFFMLFIAICYMGRIKGDKNE